MRQSSLRLTTKLVIAFLLISLIPLMILAWVNQHSLQQTLIDNGEKTLSAAGAQTAATVDTFILANKKTLETIAQLPDFVTFLDIPPAQRPGAKALRDIMRVLRNSDPEYISAFVLLDAEGTVVAERDRYDYVGQKEADKDYFKIPFETNETYVSPVRYNSDTEEWTWYFSSPVRNLIGQPIGVLYMRYDASILQSLVEPSNGLVGPESFPILLDENQRYLAHATEPTLAFTMFDLPPLTEQLVDLREPAFFTTENLPGTSKQMRLAVVPLNHSAWVVVFAQPEAVFLGPVQAQLQTTIFFAIAIAGAVVIIAVFMGRQLATPLVQLTRAVTRFREGHHDTRLRLDSNDELGILAENFNSMAAQVEGLVSRLESYTQELEAEIQERKRAEMTLQEYKEHLEDLVAQRTVELAQSVNKLATSQRLLWAVIDGMPDRIFAKDKELRWILVNKAFADAVGYTPQSMIGKNDLELGFDERLVLGDPEQGIVGFWEEDRRVLQGEIVYRPYDPAVKLVENERSFDTYKLPLRDETGKIFGIVAIGRDITELKQIETELREARDLAEAASRSKSAFLANVSHELRTPLTSILGFTRMVQKRLLSRILPLIEHEADLKVTRAKHQITDNLTIILSEGQRLTHLINNVLDLAKIEANRMAWRMEPCEIEVIIQKAINNSGGLLTDKPLHIGVDLPDTLPMVRGDFSRLLQVMLNLLSNAIKFTDEGQIICRARLVGEGMVEVSVQDTGSGIEPDDQPKVFRKFEQVGETLTDKPHGTGLGLPICREIILHHGGEIWVESEVGQGSTFFFTLPIYQD